MRASSATYGRSSRAPSEQLTPTISGSACSIDAQNASIVCPLSVRPDRSTIVTEIQSGSSRRDVARRGDRRLRVQRVEDRLDQEQVGAAVGQAADLLRVRLAHLRRTCASGSPGSSTFGLSDSVMFSGPTEPATNLPPAASAASRASRAPATFISYALLGEPVVGLADRRRRERVRRRDVGAGREVRVVHRAHDLRLRDVQQIRVVVDRQRVVAEALAAEVGLAPARAPGAARPTRRRARGSAPSRSP